jgi:hypothetical protein
MSVCVFCLNRFCVKFFQGHSYFSGLGFVLF